MLIEVFAPWEQAFGYQPWTVLLWLLKQGYRFLFACPNGMVDHLPTEAEPFPPEYEMGCNVVAYDPKAHAERIEGADLNASAQSSQCPHLPPLFFCSLRLCASAPDIPDSGLPHHESTHFPDEPTKRRSHKFTLFELLVVIWITVLVASVVFPALNKARTKAYQSSCWSATFQAGQAQIMYASDHGGSMTGRVQWAWKLEPYTAAAGAYACPLWGTGRATRQAAGSGYCAAVYDQYTQVEGYHVGFSVACSTTGSSTGRKMDSLRYPATTMWLAESDGTCAQHSNPYASCANGPVVATRHDGGCSTTFVDGHSAWEKASTGRIWNIQPWRNWLDLNK